MSVGVVVLSKASTPELAAVTGRMLGSLAVADRATELDVVVVEQAMKAWHFRTVFRADSFNFNAFANFGATQVDGDHLLICNNDLVFHRASIDLLHSYAIAHDLPVVCPVCPLNPRQAGLLQPETGTEVGKHFAGWCFLIRRDAWEAIGRFDEDFPFWYADDATVEQLKRAGLSVTVLPSAVVEHRASSTLSTLPRMQRSKLTKQQHQRFLAKYGATA